MPSPPTPNSPWDHREASRRADRRPVQHPGHAEVEGTADVRRRDRHGDPVDPDRRRRDHPAHAVRRDRAVAAHRDQRDQRWSTTWTLLPGAIEEMLRWTSPVKNMCRTLTADNEFHGTPLREGEKIILLFESANFDEEVFDESGNFNIERYPNNHLAFGFGTHFCLGNQLARLELSTHADRVLQRLPDCGWRRMPTLAVAAGQLRQPVWSRCRWCSLPARRSEPDGVGTSAP